jgi:hypothetical protein
MRAATAALLLATACGDDAGSGGGSSETSGKTASSTGSGAGGEGAGTSISSQSSSSSSSGGGPQGGGGAGGVDPWAGPLEHLAELPLGEEDIGTPIIFPVPDRALGITTLSQTPDDGPMGVAQLRPRNSTNVVTDFEIPGTGMPFFIDEHALTVASPQSDLAQAWPVLEGNWRLRLGADGPTTATSSVFVRRTMDGAFHGGVVDMNVFLAPGAGVDAAYVSTVIDQIFSTYWGPGIGLTKGNVTFQSLASSFDSVDSDQELGAMFATSQGVGPAPAVNLFVVGDFTFVNALGIAGGIPAAPMVHGTEKSGVAYTPTDDPGYDASILAHEMGHLAGLFHTTEIQVAGFDPLGDTVTCPNIMNMNPQSCPDVGNVMFPIAYGGGSFSALQARVVQGSAAYRGILEEGGLPGAPLPQLAPVSPRAPVSPPTYLLSRAPKRAPRTPLEQTLTAHWCDRVSDIEGYVLAALQPTADALESIAQDDGMPDHARARALGLLGSVDPARAADLARLALTHDRGRRLRLRALALLDAAAPSELGEVVEPLRPFDDPVIEARLDALGLRP